MCLKQLIMSGRSRKLEFPVEAVISILKSDFLHENIDKLPFYCFVHIANKLYTKNLKKHAKFLFISWKRNVGGVRSLFAANCKCDTNNCIADNICVDSDNNNLGSNDEHDVRLSYATASENNSGYQSDISNTTVECQDSDVTIECINECFDSMIDVNISDTFINYNNDIDLDDNDAPINKACEFPYFLNFNNKDSVNEVGVQCNMNEIVKSCNFTFN